MCMYVYVYVYIDTGMYVYTHVRTLICPFLLFLYVRLRAILWGLNKSEPGCLQVSKFPEALQGLDTVVSRNHGLIGFWPLGFGVGIWR